ncbi:DegT/DnrJ/EryC1/StrS family aminotransferase [Streptomyces alkaliphilus]|uniref:DegT/DnrJ/EryC1/StrS family aminotransferase n=1 Tax=Streptomyces alkaliphilus TaxID=1472722 RepID=UPI00117EB8FE|nr:DegT/DnrJ/EryC1/StrS family aminotransferase [Streptomyces alkaliphilus]MQS06137.1 aminotransferase class I/II-fold pyridoxal phosphate-dependent enzyme [Streptomyces alkaliphilus]
MDPVINVVQPALGERELAAVREVFESNWVGRGARTTAFEAAFARHLGVGSEHVTATNSCTSATFMAMELLGLGPGEEVVLPTVSFVAVGNAIAACGARPVFCDVDEATLNPTVADVEAVLTERTRAVVILHYGGRPGAVAEIAELCRDRGVQLIEDAALAVASTVDGRACGTFGDMGLWSFDHAKIVVTVDGGMLYVRDPELAARAPEVAYLGLKRPASGSSGPSTSFHSGFDQALRSNSRWWDYDVASFSRRSTTNDVLSAIGTVQLSRLEEFVDRRREIARAYDEGLAGVAGLRLPPPLPVGHTTSHFMYWVQFENGVRDRVARDLYERSIYTTFRYPLMHRVGAYGSNAVLPRAEAAAERTLLLPIHQSLSDADVDRVITEVRDCVAARSGGARATA